VINKIVYFEFIILLIRLKINIQSVLTKSKFTVYNLAQRGDTAHIKN